VRESVAIPILLLMVGILAMPASAQTGGPSAVVDAIQAREAQAIATFDQVLAGFEAFLTSAPSDAVALAEHEAAKAAIDAELAAARTDIDALAEAFPNHKDVKDARNASRQAVNDAAAKTRGLLGTALGGYQPPTTTTTTTTTTTPASTTTTTTTASTTTTTTTASTTTTTTTASTTTTQPSAGDDGTGTDEVDEGPVTFLSGGSGPTRTAPDQEAFTPRPRNDRPGFVLAWIQDDLTARYTEILLGPLVVVEAMVRALVTAGRGLAAPASLLISLVAVLAMDRSKMSERFRGEEPQPG
jgi:hypothetical protein